MCVSCWQNVVRFQPTGGELIYDRSARKKISVLFVIFKTYIKNI